MKRESAGENARFLKDEYGIGGKSPAVGKLDLWHESTGLKISRVGDTSSDAEIILPWSKVEKRIRELISADRYLSPAEKEQYPAYREQRAVIAARTKISEEFRSIVNDYKNYVAQLGQQDKTVDRWYLVSCAGAFSAGQDRKSVV